MMMRPSTYTPAQGESSTTPVGSRKGREARGAADFLRAHDKMAAILPGLTKMMALQKACAAALPAMFGACAVLQFESCQLVLSTPNAALAAKLKQQLPKLQETLQQQGWQVNAIRLRVQVMQPVATQAKGPRPALPREAAAAFAALGAALPTSSKNAALKAAIETMVRRRR